MPLIVYGIIVLVGLAAAVVTPLVVGNDAPQKQAATSKPEPGQQQSPPPAAPVSVSIEFGPANRRALSKTAPFKAGMTALDALTAVAEVTFTEADVTHPKAVQSIEGVATDLERGRFWMLEVDGVHAQEMPQMIAVHPGTRVRWVYQVPPVTVRIEYGPAARQADEVQVDFVEGMTVLDALRRAADVRLTRADPEHPEAVDSVNGVRTDLARNRFWHYTVNGKVAQVMAQDFELKSGFEMTWTYTEYPDEPPADEQHKAGDDRQRPTGSRGLKALGGLGE